MTSVSMDYNRENVPPQDDLVVGILAYSLRRGKDWRGLFRLRGEAVAETDRSMDRCYRYKYVIKINR